MTRLALIVCSAPWQERSGREALDLAMSAVAMDVSLRLFFIGDGLLQLVADRQSGAAGLPPGQKAWASLTALGEVDFFAHANEIDDLLLAGIELLVPLEALQVGAMPAYQADHQVLVV